MADCFLYDKCNHIDCDSTFCMRRYKLEYLFAQALVPNAKRTKMPLCPDSDGTDYNEFVKLSSIENDITQFVNSGDNLYIYSSQAGNGKSSWAYRMIGAYLYKNWSRLSLNCHALFVPIATFLQAMKDNINTPNEYFLHIQKNIINADLVVFDDVAIKQYTAYELDSLFSIIDTRLANNKTCIFTSNLDKQGLITCVGPRLASRMYESSIAIKLNGADKRHIGVKEV